MSDRTLITGQAASIRIDNLDTDQIMPKQFLHGIDKSGLAEGLLYDLRVDPNGVPRADFVLNRPDYAQTRILLAGSNFGCGSSREHAVWGLQQFGIQAVVAPSFAEIFYSNAMNNRLLLVALPDDQVAAMMRDADDPRTGDITIDLDTMRVQSASVNAGFSLSPRHRRMFLEGLDVIGLSLTYQSQIQAFAADHWTRYPWMKNVARTARDRLSA